MIGLAHLLSMLGQVLHSDKSLATEMTFNFVRTPGISLEGSLSPVRNWRGLWSEGVTVAVTVTLGVDPVLSRLQVPLEDGLGNEDSATVWTLESVVILGEVGHRGHGVRLGPLLLLAGDWCRDLPLGSLGGSREPPLDDVVDSWHFHWTHAWRRGGYCWGYGTILNIYFWNSFQLAVSLQGKRQFRMRLFDVS